MIHLLVGPDRYLLERELKRILAAADPDGLNTTRYDKTTSVGEISNSVATAGFFGTGRVIVAEGVMARASGVGKAKKAEANEIGALVTSVAPGNTLILIDPEIQTVPKAVRELVGAEAIQFGGRVPRGSDLVEWVQTEVRELGGKIERRNAEKVLNRLFPGDWMEPNRNPQYDNPPDLQRLMSELAKLATAASGTEIAGHDIDELVHSGTADELFPLIDAVIQGNAAAAFKRLQGQESDDDAASRIVNQIGANAELGQIAGHFTGESTLAAVAKQIGLSNPRRLGAIQRNLTRHSAESLAKQLVESDRRLKTGYTRSVSDQLQEIIVRRATKKRGQ
jgi:DNA polymerase III delta subunit